MNQRNVKTIVFGKDNITTSTATKIDDVSSAAATVGTLWVVDEANNVLTAAATKATKFKVAYKSTDGSIVYSDTVDPKSVVSYKGKASVAPTEQVTYIGYNGTSGSITTANNTEFTVRLNLLSLTETDFMQDKLIYGSYTSDAAGTQAEIANGIVANLNANFSKLPDVVVKAEVVCSNAGTTLTMAGGSDSSNLVWTKGSKYVTSDLLGSDEVIDTIVAGDYIRAGTAVSSPIFLVVSNSAGTGSDSTGTPATIELADYYRGTTQSIALAGNEYITAANVGSASVGIKLSSLTKKYNLTNFKFEKQRFEVLLTNFGATALTTTARAYEGSGYYKSVAEMEAFCQGNEFGTPNRSQAYGPLTNIFRGDASLFGTYYSLVTIVYKDEMTTTIGNEASSLKELIIALGAGSDTATTVTTTGKANKDTNAGITVLDAIIATSAGVGSALTSIV